MSKVGDIKREIERRLGPSDETSDKARIDPLACIAPGCPMRWSCDMGKGKLCSWHDSASRIRWQEITDELLRLKAAGLAPVYPELKQAAWVKDAAERARNGPKFRLGELLP